jgi:hypothetical protein
MELLLWRGSKGSNRIATAVRPDPPCIRHKRRRGYSRAPIDKNAGRL